MVQVVIFTRFNRVFADNDIRRNKVLQSKTWWNNRYKILQDTLIRSLEYQSDDNFTFMPIFNKAQCDMYPHVENFYQRVGGYKEDHNPATEFEPLQLAAETPEDTIFFNVDSDDHIHKDTVRELKKLQPKEGLCPYMERGYVYDLKSKKMAHYSGNGAEPPFWGIYVPGSMRDVKTIHRYMKDHRMDGRHYDKHKASNAVMLPDGMYLYSIHGKNTTNAWKNPNTAKHVGDVIRSKKTILGEFGYEGR